jgi:hypothetical protein
MVTRSAKKFKLPRSARRSPGEAAVLAKPPTRCESRMAISTLLGHGEILVCVAASYVCRAD